MDFIDNYFEMMKVLTGLIGAGTDRSCLFAGVGLASVASL